MKFNLFQAVGVSAGVTLLASAAIPAAAFAIQHQKAHEWNNSCRAANDAYEQIAVQVEDNYYTVATILDDYPHVNGTTWADLLGEANDLINESKRLEHALVSLNSAAYRACMVNPELDWSPLQVAWGEYHHGTTLKKEYTRFLFNDKGIEAAKDAIDEAYDRNFG